MSWRIKCVFCNRLHDRDKTLPRNYFVTFPMHFKDLPWTPTNILTESALFLCKLRTKVLKYWLGLARGQLPEWREIYLGNERNVCWIFFVACRMTHIMKTSKRITSHILTCDSSCPMTCAWAGLQSWGFHEWQMRLRRSCFVGFSDHMC